MIKNLLFILGLFLLPCFSQESFAQVKPTYQSRNKLKLKPKEIKKLTFIELSAGDKSFPPSYLLGMRDDNLILATDIAKNWMDKSLYVKSEVNLKYYDHLLMMNRNEKHRKMAIWGAIFGAAGYYFAQRKALPNQYEVRNKIILGQPTNNGVTEGILGAVAGVGFGLIIGRELSKRRMNLRSQKRKAVRKLKEFSFYE